MPGADRLELEYEIEDGDRGVAGVDPVTLPVTDDNKEEFVMLQETY